MYEKWADFHPRQAPATSLANLRDQVKRNVEAALGVRIDIEDLAEKPRTVRASTARLQVAVERFVHEETIGNGLFPPVSTHQYPSQKLKRRYHNIFFRSCAEPWPPQSIASFLTNIANNIRISTSKNRRCSFRFVQCGVGLARRMYPTSKGRSYSLVLLRSPSSRACQYRPLYRTRAGASCAAGDRG